MSIESQLEASYVLTVGVLAVHGRRMHTSRISDRFASFDVVYPVDSNTCQQVHNKSLTVGEVLIIPCVRCVVTGQMCRTRLFVMHERTAAMS